MATGFNPQYQQQQSYCPTQYAGATPSASAVNIQIFNPTANACPQSMMQYPMMQSAPSLYPNGSLYDKQQDGNPGITYPMNYNAPINQTNNYNALPMREQQPKEALAEPKKEEKKADDKKKEKVILTDDYIKSLENYLNNQNPKVRLSAAKELLERFKEDNTRQNDPALCALLNKVLQDPKASVRYIALTTLDVGYALGNEETIQILQQLQNKPELEYGEDAVLASQILLKMAGHKVEVPASENSFNITNTQNKQNDLKEQPQTKEAA